MVLLNRSEASLSVSRLITTAPSGALRGSKMNKENGMKNKELTEYLKAYLGDLNYWSGLDVGSVNHYTSSTPEFESIEELKKYIKPLEDLLKKEDNEAEKEQIEALKHWEKSFRQGYCSDEHGEYLAGVLASERMRLERRIESYEMGLTETWLAEQKNLVDQEQGEVK